MNYEPWIICAVVIGVFLVVLAAATIPRGQA